MIPSNLHRSVSPTPILDMLNSMDKSDAEKLLQNGVQTLNSQNQQLGMIKYYKKNNFICCEMEIARQSLRLFSLGLRFDAVEEKIRGEENGLFKKCSDFQKDEDLLYELPEGPQRLAVSIAALQKIIDTRETKIQEYENALSQLEKYVREQEVIGKIRSSVVPAVGNFFQRFNGGAPPPGDGSSQKAWSIFIAGVGTIFFLHIVFPHPQ